MDTHPDSAGNGPRHSPSQQQQQEQQQPMTLGRLLEIHANTQGQVHSPATAPAKLPASGTSEDDTLQNRPAGPENSQPPTGKKKKKNRHRRRRNRRPSFIAADEDHPGTIMADRTSDRGSSAQELPRERPPFYRGRNLSTTSLESEALLDHRNQPHQMRARRDSRLNQSFRPESYTRTASFFSSNAEGATARRPRSGQRHPYRSESEDIEEDEGEEEQEMDDRTPLIASHYTSSPSRGDYGTASYLSRTPRRPSLDTSSSRRALSSKPSPAGPQEQDRDYDVNNPPSVPGSPKTGIADMGYDDAVVTGIEFPPGPRSPDTRRDSASRLHDVVIDMEGGGGGGKRSRDSSRPPSPRMPTQDSLHRRRTITLPAEGDVCFPTELAEASRDEVGGRRRRRRREWPDLAVLEEWSREEKEERSGEFRVKKISEPVLVGGRLRPQYAGWRREEEDAPYRFTYFNEDFQSTIHAQTISELVQPGGSFRELFIPDPPELEDSSSEEDEDLISLYEPGAHHQMNHTNNHSHRPSNGQDSGGSQGPGSVPPARSENDPKKESHLQSSQLDMRSDTDTSFLQQTPRQPKPKRYGPRPTWWLDVLCPTDPEMRVIAKTFGIHALTAEDIMMQEAREKVELFRHYYFLNYRTFEQDSNSENYLQPVNMYVVVFREGVLSFHFSQTPHPANVRRRIRQLRDYLILSSDWICYALIDDITDVFGPLIQSIENEVDDVDDAIMQMHSRDDVDKEFHQRHKKNDTNSNDDGTSPAAGGDMLRRVGECRKKVMGMYRLLSNKADVIKGFAKRCNEQWEVAPKSEIGLYLGDIQDHIMTMTSNLTHYETLLSRAHSNYLAQINILMNERQERTADVLGKLTVLGTIVLPMNIICGMWGMNVKVPGQDVDNLYWFWSITAGLVFFGVVCFYVAKRVYRIV
ncbi:hypothetical protein VTN77DRAFT_2525 [Rasamsonia byssochlamydoides]|uniref:uncharacterized protein n=1 Tax=Rasamsonia byssochlamydoides TaxID=89139 RepID=UPI0037424BF6